MFLSFVYVLIWNRSVTNMFFFWGGGRSVPDLFFTYKTLNRFWNQVPKGSKQFCSIILKRLHSIPVSNRRKVKDVNRMIPELRLENASQYDMQKNREQ